LSSCVQCRGVEFDHVKLSLVHKFFQIQGIGIIPLKQFKPSDDILHFAK
jgi:hypothetical protein